MANLIKTKSAKYGDREGTRFWFDDGRYVTVWHDGGIRLGNGSRNGKKPALWVLRTKWRNRSNVPGARVLELDVE